MRDVKVPTDAVRLAWLDVARGIGIILVVFGHVERGLVTAGIATGAGWALIDRAIYTFHMPLFVLLAGVNVPESLLRGTRRFLTGKLSTVAYPYVLWSLIQGSVLVMLSRMTNGKTRWSALAKIGWQPISPFWFLYALFVFFLIVAAVKIRGAVLILLSVAGMVASALLLSGESLLHLMCYMFSFFVIGTLGSDIIKNWHPNRLAAWLTGSALLWIIAFQIVPSEGPTPYLTPWALPSALAGILFILAGAHLLRGRSEAVFARLGRYSMSIYVMHIFAAAGTRIAIAKSHIQAPVALYVIACTTVGIAAPILVHVLLARANLLPLFGLGKRKGRITTFEQRPIPQIDR